MFVYTDSIFSTRGTVETNRLRLAAAGKTYWNTVHRRSVCIDFKINYEKQKKRSGFMSHH